MKTVFVNSIQHFCEDECISERLKKCYTNTGNFVWHDCCKKEIDYDYEVDCFIDSVVCAHAHLAPLSLCLWLAAYHG